MISSADTSMKKQINYRCKVGSLQIVLDWIYPIVC